MSDSNDPGRSETETSLPRSPDRQKAAKMALYHKICTVVARPTSSITILLTPPWFEGNKQR